MIRANEHVNRWADRLRIALRPVDRVGIYGPTAVLVSVPEATPELVRSLRAELSDGDPALACSAVMFPQDGGTVDELIAAVQGKRSDVPAESDVIVKNAAMKQVMATVKRLAGSTIAVLLHGETGTGKEVIATAIHEAGPR